MIVRLFYQALANGARASIGWLCLPRTSSAHESSKSLHGRCLKIFLKLCVWISVLIICVQYLRSEGSVGVLLPWSQREVV